MKKEILIGFFIGIVATFIGCVLFLIIFTEFNALSDFIIIKRSGILGKVITLGALLNLLLFYIFLKKDKENISKGILLSTITLALITLIL